MNYNALARVTTSTVKNEPFPYVVVDNALPDDLYERLARTYPDPAHLSADKKAKNNNRYNLLSKWGNTEYPYEEASEEWKAFTEANASPQFVSSVFGFFPDFVENVGGSPKIDLGKYGPDLAGQIKVAPKVGFDEVIPRVTIGVNSPVTEVSSVRGAHMDNIRKAYVGLMYFRAPEDDSTGGDLELFRWKAGHKAKNWASKVPRSEVEVIETVSYVPNRLVLFLNTSNSLHGVSPRSVTPHWRRLVVLSGWFTLDEAKAVETGRGRLKRTLRSFFGGGDKPGAPPANAA